MKQFHWVLICYTLTLIAAIFGCLLVDMTPEVVKVAKFIFYLFLVVFLILVIFNFEGPKPSEKEETQDFDSELKRLAEIDIKAYIDSDFDYEYRLNRFVYAIIPILKSSFKITRIK